MGCGCFAGLSVGPDCEIGTVETVKHIAGRGLQNRRNAFFQGGITWNTEELLSRDAERLFILLRCAGIIEKICDGTCEGHNSDDELESLWG